MDSGKETFTTGKDLVGAAKRSVIPISAMRHRTRG